MNTSKKFGKVVVVGAGLAGVEVAYTLAQNGVEVHLFEGKGKERNPAQSLPGFAELVCTNSLKSMRESSAHGLLKTEMRKLGSIVLSNAVESQVPAGDALAVDRKIFSEKMTGLLKSHPLIHFHEQQVEDPEKLREYLEADYCVVATGPLSSGGIDKWMSEKLSENSDLYFYDAIAPIVDADSLNMDVLYYKDRHKEEGSGDYLNIPLDKQQYEDFVAELVSAKKVPAQSFEDYKFFESCLPIDTMAERGKDTPRYSCMKPIGLEYRGEIPYAVVQLRKENLLGDAYNMVGFQTKLTYGEQKRVFRMLPGMEQAEFLHLGSIHRNSFLNSKKVLNRDLSAIKYPQIHFAGQITGVEGYTESASIGLYVAQQILAKLEQRTIGDWPVESCIGALVNYIMTADKPRPSNINFGLLPPVLLSKEQRKSRDRRKIKKQLVVERAKKVFDQFMSDNKLKGQN